MSVPVDPLWGSAHARPAERELAGRWRRVAAHRLDGVIIGAMAVIMLIAISALFGLAFFADDDAGWTALVVGFLIWLPCVAMVREVLVQWLLFGTVLGGATAGIAPLLDYLWPLGDAEHRAPHDFLVDTRTVLE